MRYQVVYENRDAEQNAANPRAASHQKLTTGEYRLILRQQYENLARHQQVIEAEGQAEDRF